MRINYSEINYYLLFFRYVFFLYFNKKYHFRPEYSIPNYSLYISKQYIHLSNNSIPQFPIPPNPNYPTPLNTPLHKLTHKLTHPQVPKYQQTMTILSCKRGWRSMRVLRGLGLGVLGRVEIVYTGTSCAGLPKITPSTLISQQSTYPKPPKLNHQFQASSTN
jgi:hypothetical protein